VESILVLLIESGAVYCVMWIAYFLATLYSEQFGAVGAYLQIAMDQLVGMYPTLIVLVIALQKSNIDRQVSHQLRISKARSDKKAFPNADMAPFGSVVLIGDAFETAELRTEDGSFGGTGPINEKA